MTKENEAKHYVKRAKVSLYPLVISCLCGLPLAEQTSKHHYEITATERLTIYVKSDGWASAEAACPRCQNVITIY